MLKTKQDVYALLKILGASERLILHLKLVGEAAEELLAALDDLELGIEENFVRLGVAVHDAGKIVHPRELDNPGNQHEPAGEELLLKAGVQAEIARCCLSHARYDLINVSLEELLVALSDKLWKGKREHDLELRVIDQIADKAGKGRWDIFSFLDECFEGIASKGDERLLRSAVIEQKDESNT